MEKFLDLGADINSLDRLDNNFLNLVCSSYQNLEIIKLLIKEKIDIYKQNYCERNALHSLSENEKTTKNVLQYFSEIGYKFTIESSQGNALHHYLKGQNLNMDMIKIYLDNKCEINSKNKQNNSCFTLVTQKHSWDYKVLEYFLEIKADINNGSSPLLECEDNLKKIKFLLDNKCRVNAQDQNGSTLLHR